MRKIISNSHRYYRMIKARLFLLFIRKIRLGSDNPDKIFYLIRRGNPTVGAFSNYYVFLKHIRYAISKNYIPVIDLQYDESYIYHEPEQVGFINVWELYFSQPFGYTVKDVMTSKSVIMSNSNVKKLFNMNIEFLLKNDKILSEWSHIANNYLKYNEKTQQYLDGIYKSLVPSGKKVLGVSFRYGYSAGRPSGHPIQPSIDEIIDKVNNSMYKSRYDYIFLSVEDHKVVSRFKIEFKEKLIVISRPRINDNTTVVSKNSSIDKTNYISALNGIIQEDRLHDLNNYMETVSFDREDDKYLKGLEYISEMYILSKCDYLICGQSSGTWVCAIIKNDPKSTYMFELGNY